MCTSSSCANSCSRRVLNYQCQPQQRLFLPLKLFIPFRSSDFLSPKMMVIIALLFCWNLQNSLTTAVFQNSNKSFNRLPYFPNESSSFRPSSPNNPQPHHHHHLAQRTLSNIRLRAPSSLNQISQLARANSFSLGGAGITLADDTAPANSIMIRSIPSSSSSSALIPYEVSLGQKRQSGLYTEVDGEITSPKRKKDCEEPSITTRGLTDPSFKRSYFAFTQDEVNQKIRDDEYRQTSERRKREVQHRQLSVSLESKRNADTEGTTASPTDVQNSKLPWTCETEYEWKDMGTNHYPRFIRVAECKNRLCFNGFFRCRPRRYNTKVLKRITPADSTSCEANDVSLPESLRQGWRFVTVTISLCCDCTGQLPNTG